MGTASSADQFTSDRDEEVMKDGGWDKPGNDMPGSQSEGPLTFYLKCESSCGSNAIL